MHLSIHIERTGGTSLLGELEAFYGPERILIYSASKDKLMRMSDIPVSPANESLSKIKAFIERTKFLSFIYQLYMTVLRKSDDVFTWYDPENIPNDVDAIQGHFSPDRFSQLLPTAFTSVVLRDPLERMISQFLHWQRAGGDMGFRVAIPYDPEMTFEEYAFQEELINFQTRALGSLAIDDFDLVGITPRLDRFVAKIIGKPHQEEFQSTQVNYMGQKPKHKELGITPALIKKFKKVNAEDYKNYQRAIALSGSVVE